MLLRLWNHGAVIDDGAVRDGVQTVVDRDGGGDERAVGVVASADFRKLAGAPAHGILMTLCTGPGVEDRAQAGAGIVILLEPCLVHCIMQWTRQGSSRITMPAPDWARSSTPGPVQSVIRIP